MTIQPTIPDQRPRLPDQKRIDWAPVLNPRGPWSALVVAGSSPARVSRNCAGIVYISAPYHAEAQIRGAWRVERSVLMSIRAANEVGRLAACGCTALAPTVQIAEAAHAKVLNDDTPDPLDRVFWDAWSQPILNVAALIAIPDIPGWDRCPMVWRDLRFALAHNLPVHIYGGLQP
ncbi:DUF1937 domain-containing protein [Pararhodobacter marinus]|uniref:DUF1937 domain-containing protein n=1 Tax=Pararhodobacter marinus TaxID=2184063 RepID=A0A2U2C475_9RHOB|nr:DUF1937 family protein [Pararhodobacter marinus]PWE26662.1 DUF1937 domain-containing protein [Pararhodobacter marinus]